MANVIKLGYSNTSGHTPDSLAGGEVGINTNNRKIWVGNGSGNTLVFNHADYAAASHTHSYDNYSAWNIQANGGTAGTVNSGTTLDFIQSGATTISRSGNDITISSTDTNTWRGISISVSTCLLYTSDAADE